MQAASVKGWKDLSDMFSDKAKSPDGEEAQSPVGPSGEKSMGYGSNRFSMKFIFLELAVLRNVALVSMLCNVFLFVALFESTEFDCLSLGILIGHLYYVTAYAFVPSQTDLSWTLCPVVAIIIV